MAEWLLTVALWAVGLSLLALPVIALVGIMRVAWSGGFGSGWTGRAAGVFVAVCVFGVLALFIWGMAFAMYAKEREAARKGICLSNVKHLSLAAVDFARDHDGRLPAAERWCDELLPYVKGREVFRCPSAPDLSCGFAFNSSVSEVRLEDLSGADTLVLIFESDEGWNASGSETLLPDGPRHFRGDDYGFVDGHGAWGARRKLADGRWAKEPVKSDLRWSTSKEDEAKP